VPRRTLCRWRIAGISSTVDKVQDVGGAADHKSLTTSGADLLHLYVSNQCLLCVLCTMQFKLDINTPALPPAFEMTYIVSGGAFNSTHSLLFKWQ